MMGRYFVLAAVSVALAGCSGPLVSDPGITGSANGYSSSGTASGSYCLSKTLLRLDVSDAAIAAAAGDIPGANLHAGAPDIYIKLDHYEVPDVEHIFSLSYRESSFANDTINVQFVQNPTRTCILKHISTDTEDRTLDVAKNVAATVLHAVTGIPSGGTARLGGAPSPKPATPREVQLLLDIDHIGYKKEQDRINNALHAAGFDLSIFIQPIGTIQGAQGLADPDPSKSYEGVFYRTPLPYRFIVQRGQAAIETDADVEAEGLVFSENGAPLQFLPIKRSAFVRRVTTIDFDNGLPVNVNTVKPSEAEAFTQFPLTLTDEIVSIPSKAVTVHVQNETTTK